jgi:hypothetical protein
MTEQQFRTFQGRGSRGNQLPRHTNTCVTLWSSASSEDSNSPTIQEFPAFYGIQRFITVFTTARHLCLSWGQSLQSSTSRLILLRPILILSSHLRLGDAARWGTALQTGRSQVRFPIVSLALLFQFFRSHCGPGVDSAHNRNEYGGYLLGVKAAGA